MKNLGIHARLMLAAVMLLAGASFALGLIGVHIFHEFALQRFHDRMNFLARHLALNSELGILIDEPEMLDTLAENLLSEKDVARVRINSRKSGLLADRSKETQGPVHEIMMPVSLKTGHENNLPFKSLDSPGTEKTIGSVKISYTTSGINELVSSIRKLFFWIAAGLAMLCAVIFFYISRSIVNPLKRLVNAARQAGEGNLDMRVPLDPVPETRELGAAFNEMLESIENSRQAIENAHTQMLRQQILAEMGKFSMMVAHEVKNPLGIIKTSLDMLKKRMPENAKSTVLFEDIEDEINQLNKLIEDFLNFAQPAVPSFSPVDANSLLWQLVERFDSMYEDVEFESSIPDDICRINADQGLCSRAIFNIISNAVSANNEEGIIRVAAECTDHTWKVTISDQGAGISEENREKIFEPFYSTRSKGSGLGLTFASQVLKAHGGSISAGNGSSGGAVFTVRVPVFQ